MDLQPAADPYNVDMYKFASKTVTVGPIRKQLECDHCDQEQMQGSRLFLYLIPCSAISMGASQVPGISVKSLLRNSASAIGIVCWLL